MGFVKTAKDNANLLCLSTALISIACSSSQESPSCSVIYMLHGVQQALRYRTGPLGNLRHVVVFVDPGLVSAAGEDRI